MNLDLKVTLINSPNFPLFYPFNTEKTWLIAAPVESIITLQFHSFHVRLIVESMNERNMFQIFCFTD